MKLKSATAGLGKHHGSVRLVYEQSGGRELSRWAGPRGVLAPSEVAALFGVPKIRIQRMMARKALEAVTVKGHSFILCCRALKAKRDLAGAEERS